MGSCAVHGVPTLEQDSLLTAAIIVSRLAEGEGVDGALLAAGIDSWEFARWKQSDPAMEAVFDDAELNGELFTFWHEHWEEIRAQEYLLTLFNVALETGDTCGLPAPWAQRVREARRAFHQGVGQPRRPPKAQRPRCDARTRAGGLCRAQPEPGRTRCKLHGGKTPRPRERLEEELLWDRAHERAILLLAREHHWFGALTRRIDPSYTARGQLAG